MTEYQAPTPSLNAQRGDKKMPKLCCPVCKGRLLDAANTGVFRRTHIGIYREGEEADYVIKCRHCSCSVSIRSK